MTSLRNEVTRFKAPLTKNLATYMNTTKPHTLPRSLKCMRFATLEKEVDEKGEEEYGVEPEEEDKISNKFNTEQFARQTRKFVLSRRLPASPGKRNVGI